MKMGTGEFSKLFKRKILVAVLLGVVAGCLACSAKPADSESSGSEYPSPSPGPSPTPTPVPVAFEVIISDQYENLAGTASGTATQEADCQVLSTAAIPTVVSCTNPAGIAAGTTSVAIPQGRLHYSALTFTTNIPAGNSNCVVGIFTPFSYTANNTSAAFDPPWAPPNSTFACNTPPLPVGCYGGAAIDIVPEFPNFKSVLYETSAANTFTATAHSAYYHLWGSDRFAVNNLVDLTANHTWTNGDAYVANTWQNYVFSCYDQYADLQYQINLVITKIDDATSPNDPGSPATNIFPDWSAASYDF
jgi:hypothetical protein